MITRNLKRRLQRLEDRILPGSEEPHVLVIQFVNSDRQIVDEKRITLPAALRTARRSRW